MPIRPIPINGPYHTNVDSDALTDIFSSLLQDVYIDESGANNSRPGSTLEESGFGYGAATHGAYEWSQLGYYIFVQGGKIFAKKSKDGAPEEILGATLELNNQVTFAYNGTYLVMANGGKMVYTDGSTASYISHADAPIAVTHVAYIDGYILANDSATDKVWRSDLDDVLTWGATWYFQAESVPDTVEALHVIGGRICVFGPATVEIWYNAGLSGGTPFARQQVIEHGIIAPNSVVSANNTLYWLNEERRLVFLNGSVAQSVSLPVDKSFAEMGDVSDAYSMLWRVGGRYFLVYAFTSANKTWAYDLILDRWYAWGRWYKGKYDRLLYSTMTYMQAWGLHLAGSRLTENIYSISLSAYDDAGEEIRCENRTGWVSHGAATTKRSKRVRITVKRGAVTLNSSDLTVKPKLIVQYRDDGKGSWSNEREIDLGGIGDAERHITLNRLGSYRTRQWRFIRSDAAPFVLVRAEEFIDMSRD